MWHEENGTFCDGICDEVLNHTGLTTNSFLLFDDLVPVDDIPIRRGRRLRTTV
jgi:hypothetical protein